MTTSFLKQVLCITIGLILCQCQPPADNSGSRSNDVKPATEAASRPRSTKSTGSKNNDKRIATPATEASSSSADSIPRGAKLLIKAYPDSHLKYANNKIIFPDGTAIRYDDGQRKNFKQQLDNSDIEDMFATPYRKTGRPAYLEDVGRSRCELLFKKMYGNSAAMVRHNLVTIDWFGQKIQFTKVNGAAKNLKAVANEVARHPEYRKYLKSSGTFYWRKVRGANRQSAHSYGIAFDVGVQYSDYWLWKNPDKSETDKIAYYNKMPLGLVKIFERHGFIWGGRWYHFDTMHFEYRPELLL